jgi:fatty-acyl-CoA synthase
VAKRGRSIDTATFRLGEHSRVFTEDGREVEPGSGDSGLIAIGGPIPVGYYKDPDKSAGTFRTFAGRTWSVPGDWATVEADGTIRLLGRGSACINSGGEKVYPEEVELALRSHPDVFDCVVVGLPDERWGEAVIALIERRPGADGLSRDDLAAHCRTTLAGYKVPKEFVTVDSLQRSPAGKADYNLLRSVAAAELGR